MCLFRGYHNKWLFLIPLPPERQLVGIILPTSKGWEEKTLRLATKWRRCLQATFSCNGNKLVTHTRVFSV